MMLFARADVVNPSAVETIAAARLSLEHRLSFWDAMIVRMANQAGCAVLFSEDLQTGRQILGLEIVDPYSVPE